MVNQLDHGASLISVGFAVSLLSFAEDLADCCDFDISGVPVPGQTADWQRFWKSSSQCWRKCLEEVDPMLAGDIQSFQAAGGLASPYSLVPVLTTATVLRRHALGRWLQRQNRLAQREFLHHLDNIITGPAEEAVHEIDLQHQHSLLFLARVYFPALARFGLPPDVLYRQAAQGDFQSLERLLALDPSAESLPEIREVLWNFFRTKRPSPLARARSQVVRTLGFKRRSCKTQMMAWIRDYSRLLAKAITPSVSRFLQGAFGICIRPSRAFTVPDLQRLFDAYARDQTGYIDPDLTGAPEAIKKMVDRCAKSFPIHHWDIFCERNVPMTDRSSA